MLTSVTAAEKQMLDKEVLTFSLVILLLPLGLKCSSPVALFGDYFILHYVIAGSLSTLIRFSKF